MRLFGFVIRLGTDRFCPVPLSW